MNLKRSKSLDYIDVVCVEKFYHLNISGCKVYLNNYHHHLLSLSIFLEKEKRLHVVIACVQSYLLLFKQIIYI